MRHLDWILNIGYGVLIISLLSVACANPGTLGGGPRDETPPQIDSSLSTPNELTNFDLDMIELTFDEWVRLDDVFNQVVISPPIQPQPEIVLKKKTVQVIFDKQTPLRENATYTINFGASIKDLTEGNVPENLRYVFSTGDFIDSLQVTGRIADILTKKPLEKILVMLYDNLADTVVRTERPFYFARTSKDGDFSIQNVRTDTFKVFALEDQNLNYLFDAENERIGFLDSFIVVNDTLQPKLDIELFLERPSLKTNNIDKSKYGLIKMAFNQPPQDLNFRYEANIPTVLFDYEKDSLRLWYELGEAENWQIIVSKDTLFSDTINVNKEKQSDFLDNTQLRLTSEAKNTIKQNPKQPFQLTFNHPIAVIDTSLIQILEDSTEAAVQVQLSIDSISTYRSLFVQPQWKQSLNYELILLPSALTDIYGLSNTDTIQQSIEVQSEKEFGTINLVVNSLDSLQQYVIQLEKGQTVLEIFKVKATKSWKHTFSTINAGKYAVTIITDLNGNGRWDTGNYDLKRQPEPIMTKELETLRANWDLEAEVLFNQ